MGSGQWAGAVAERENVLNVVNVLAVEGLKMRERVGADSWLGGGAESILKRTQKLSEIHMSIVSRSKNIYIKG